MRYIDSKGNLKDELIARELRKAAEGYENGEILETHDTIIEIAAAIEEWSKLQEAAYGSR